MDPDRARELLVRERSRVEREIARIEESLPDDELSHLDQHQADSDTDEQELAVSMLIQLRKELAAIERAEKRLEEGTYGLSVESGKPIPDERLELIPWADRTVEEQEFYEARA